MMWVVGPRSALFAPAFNVALIIVDEEHEPAYKQSEFAPYYHARDAALALARRCGAVVVMGSATPDVATYYDAQRGRHHLMTLPDRIPGADGAPIPLADTQIVDMRRELREGNRSVFSRSLSAALDDTIAAGQQAILFLNRRGSAAFIQCRDCGNVVTCSRLFGGVCAPCRNRPIAMPLLQSLAAVAARVSAVSRRTHPRDGGRHRVPRRRAGNSLSGGED